LVEEAAMSEAYLDCSVELKDADCIDPEALDCVDQRSHDRIETEELDMLA
jgi:hypothetical protein